MSYLPTTDNGLRNWATNFVAILVAMVDPTIVGLTAAQVTALEALVSDYAGKLAAAIDPATRGGATVLAKNEAKRTLIAMVRELAMAVTNHPGTTDQQRYELGLTVRDNQPTPVPPPTVSPLIDVLSVKGFTITLRLHTGDTTSRARPAGAIGATVLSYVGDAPPTTLSDWTFEGNVSRTKVSLVMPGTTPPGSKVWLTAFWYNRRSESGPATDPVSTNLPGGSVTQNAKLKIAA